MGPHHADDGVTAIQYYWHQKFGHFWSVFSLKSTIFHKATRSGLDLDTQKSHGFIKKKRVFHKSREFFQKSEF